MSHWFLTCSSCHQSFVHSDIDEERSDSLDPFWPAKPAFPEGGSNLECPNCRKSATYQRYQLMYSA